MLFIVSIIESCNKIYMMKKSKKKARYVSPRLTGASAMLLTLLCQSVRFNIQVNPLDNVNADSNSGEIFYFES